MTSVSSQHTGINYSVLWSCNHQDKFISTGSEFCIYTVLSRSDADSEYVDKSKLIALNNGMYAYALESFPCSGTVKSVSWRPSQGRNDDFVFALAISNKNTNKAVITRFVQNGSQRYFHTIADNHLNNKSYHNLEWHPLRPNYLATTMTKFRQDASIIIRDLNISPDCSPLDKFRSNADTFKGIIFDCANGEFVDSFCWLPKFQNGDKNFIAGIGSKIKLFDIKENPRTPTIISSKATNGIVADPFSSNYVMGYNDSTIEIVDLRKTTSAFCSWNVGAPISSLQWCPSRKNSFAVFLKDSSVVKVHDLCSSWEEMKSKSVNILEKGVHYDTYEKTTQLSSIASASFCRHAEFNSYLLAIDNKGYLKSVDINRLIPMSWSPNNEFICDNIEKKKPKGAAYLNFVSSDIATKMNNRACKDYGLFESLIDVENICDERDLKTFWSWIKHVKSLINEGELRKDYRFEGVNSIINREFSNKKVHSNQTEKSVMVKPDAGSRPKVKRYTSSCRSLAMKLCNWGFSDSAKNRKEYLSRLEANDEFERAAAIALFNLDMKTAVETLSRGAMIRDAREESKSNLHLVAMALSGYTNDKRAFWTKMCNDYRSMLLHPYLRAAFAFITSYDGGKFDDVIWTEPDLQLRDRIAFACMFLDDETLQNYVAPLTYEVISTGNLEGIILTGFTTDGLKLLQKFVDKTGDIQTASLAVIHGIPSAISNNERVLSWIESYREFLDRLELWHYRCKLDILRKRNRHTTPPPQTAFLSCNNCSKPINLTASDFTSPNAKYVPRIPIALQKQIKNASFDRCRNCGKALPKCAICLRNMCLDIDRLPNDTKSANIHVDGGKVMYPKKRFNSWFSWCQSCRHGGHATHMESWFANHNECPVQDCNCSCSARDSSFFAIKMCDQV